MSELAEKYAAVIKQLAAMHSDDPAVNAQLQALTVTREDWDEGHGGGHLGFNLAAGVPVTKRDTVDAWTDDEDGQLIEIIFHTVGGRIDWGEWYRVDAQPIKRWPPPSVRRSL